MCRQLGVKEATIDIWKRRCRNLGASGLRELSQLGGANARLRRLVADLTLDRQTFCRSCPKELPEGSAVV